MRNGTPHRWVAPAVLVALSLGFALILSAFSQVSAQDGAADAGAPIFADNCASCHQANGSGIPGSFPPLKGNPNATDPAHVETVVRDGLSGPLEVDGVTYDAVMPAVKGLSDEEISAVVAFVVNMAEGGGSPDVTTPKPVEPGDAAQGRSLFEGRSTFAAGGAACSGCHTAGDVGHLGGNGLGPDLTGAHARLGGDLGMAAWLKKPPSPTMTPLFTDKSLTEAEIADLVAFLAVAPEQQKASTAIDWLAVAGVVGAMALLGVMAIAYRGMRQTYAEHLRSKQ